mmetsp:Transcript_2639/g.3711  ORF Transcript_2639/g.3711 Transcript_2639/m.3711 type:complete len:511 (-) Transcript_2639:3831-5363(-)
MNDDGGSYLYQRSGETATAFAAQLSEPSIVRFLFGGDDEEETYDPWNQHNWDVIPTIPHFTGMLSLLGSGWIISKVLSDAKRREHVYHRIMLVLSTFDFFLSFWMFMAKWAHPTNQGVSKWNDPDCPQCHGTVGTCEASGFFIMLGTIAIPLYNVALSVYYYLVICKGCTEQSLKCNFEKYIHIAIPMVSLVLATIPLPLDLYNPFFFYCYISPFDYDPDTQSFGRGTLLGTRVYILMVFFIVMVSGIFMAVAMTSICVKVLRQEQRSRRYEEAFLNQQRHCVRREIPRRRRSNSTRSRSTAVVIRALLYTVPFYLTWIIPICQLTIGHICITTRIISCPGPGTTYFLQTWAAVFMPLQGFFNAIIYDVFPYFTKRRKKNDSDSNSSLTQLFASERFSGVRRSNRSLVTLKGKASNLFKVKKDDSNLKLSSDKMQNPVDSNELNEIDLVGDQESSERVASHDSNTQIEEQNNEEVNQNMKTNDINNEHDEMDENKGGELVKGAMMGEESV